MDFTFLPKEEAFRTELSSWLQENLPNGWLEGKQSVPADAKEQAKFMKDWQKTLSKGKWAGVSWPEEYGGRGASLIEEVIYEQEMARVKAPPQLNIVGTAMVGPTLLQIGTEEQKEKYVPKILNGEEIWCQGYSEPNSGSDLASLQTKAVKQGDKWIINGQKIWTSFAHLADRCFLLARTENTGKKHEGITAFIVDMHQPGVEVRPIRSINDWHHFNEVYFTDAVAYEADIVGELHKGWQVSLTLLSHERVGVARKIFSLQYQVEEVAQMAKTLTRNGQPLIENKIVLQNLVKLRSKTRALLLNFYRHLTNTIRKGHPGPEGSMDKIVSSELGQEILAYAMTLQGSTNILWKEDAPIHESWQNEYLRSMAYTIEGGTSEINRNVVGERLMGLPKDIKF